jgi:PAS domain S-box-containing protein
MSPHNLVPLVAFLFNIVLIFLVLRRDWTSFLHRIFSVFLFVLALWALGIFGMRSSPDLAHAFAWEKAVIIVGPSASVLFFHFTLLLTRAKRIKGLLPAAYTVMLAFVPFSGSGLIVSGMQLKPYGYAPILGSLFYPWILCIYFFLLIGAYNLIKSRKYLSAEERNRSAYIAAGVGCYILGGVTDVLPVIGIPMYPLGMIGNIIFCLLATIAILRHNLLDIRVIMRKGAAYVLTSAVIAVPFIVAFLLVTNVFVEGSLLPWFYFVLFVALAFALPQLWQWVQRRVDRWFYRDRYDYLKALETFSRQTQSLTDSARLGSTMVNLIAKALRSSTVCLLQPLSHSGDFTTAFSAGVNNPASVIRLKRRSALVKCLERSNSMLSYEDIEIIPQLQGVTYKEEQTLQQVEAELIVPLKAPTGQLSGVLILGKKLSEQPYTTEDKQLLSTIGSQMVTNLENARLYVASQREVTERKRAEAALKESREELRKMFESVTDAIAVIDLNGVITEVNPRTVEMHGFSSRDELLGKSAFELVAPRNHERIAANMQKALKQGTMRGVEYTLLKADGSQFPGELSTSVLKDASGNLVGHITVARDITERKQAEAALRLQRAYFQQLFDNSPEAIALLDTADRIVDLNKGFETLFGYQANEVKGRPIKDVIVPEDRIEEALALSWATFNNGGCRKETIGKRKDGSLIDVSILGYPIRFGGKTVGACVIYTDITERKRAEEEERRLQQELHLSSRLASIGELAAGVAHEINNPLTGILGFSKRLLRKSTDEEVSRDLEIINNEAQRAAKVVQNLLTFARRREPKKEYSDVNDIVQSALELRAYELETSNIEVVTALAPNLPEVMLDFHQIQEVFLNIILNAEQVMTEVHSGGKLTIRTQQIKDCVRISFTDDGPGILAEHLDKIFDPFFTTRGERGGTGLGLSVCHGIVTEHGGRIYAKSKPGKGATFFVELPVIAGK